MLSAVAALIGILVGVLATSALLFGWSRSRVHTAQAERGASSRPRSARPRRSGARPRSTRAAVGPLRSEIEAEGQDRRVQIAKVEERVVQKEAEVEARLTDVERKEQGLGDREVHVKALQDELRESRRKRSGRSSASRAHRPRGAPATPRALEGPHSPRARTRRSPDGGGGTSRRQTTGSGPHRRLAPARRREPYGRATVSVVELASDDLKGRIIGREGRNIRALEHLTGVDFIIDDTPHAVVLSSFDPLRREVARVTLDKLIETGGYTRRGSRRCTTSRSGAGEHVLQAGEQAVFEANCGSSTRSSSAFSGDFVPDELRPERPQAHARGRPPHEDHGRRAESGRQDDQTGGLLHDIGKAMSHEVEGSHALIVPARAPAWRVGGCHPCDRGASLRGSAADGRGGLPDRRRCRVRFAPGARGESLENYIRRLEALEEIATAKAGVAKAYALQAGREIRVIVEPSEIDDDAAVLLSHEIAREIEDRSSIPDR